MVVTRGWGEGRMASCYLLSTELQFARWKEFCRRVKVMVVLPKGMCGLSGCLLTAQKPANRLGWWKGKSALLQMPATGAEGGWWMSVQRPIPPLTSRGWELLQTEVCVGGGGELFTCRNSTAIFNSHLQMGSDLTSIILIVSDEVNLQFQGPFVSIVLRSILTIVAARVLSTVWSSCSSLLHWCFGIYNSEDMAQNIIYSPWERAKGSWLC